MKKILVTGGSGLIGSALKELLQENLITKIELNLIPLFLTDSSKKQLIIQNL
jgi:nucleoside-diphosphate-sugar epimerase